MLPLAVIAQDITGVWTGYLKTTDNTLPFELAISSGGKESFTGYSHTVFTFNGIDNIGVKTIVLKNKKGNVSLEDGELVYSNYTTPPKRVKLFGKLFLKTSDSLLVLSGSFFTRTIDFRAEPTSFVGTVYLRKQKGFPHTRLIAKLEEMELLHTLSFAPEQFKKKEEPAIASVTTPKETAKNKELIQVTSEKNAPVAISGEVKPKKKEKQKKEALITQTEKKPEEVKKVNTATTAGIIKNQAPVAAAALSQRKTEIIREVFFTTDSLLLSLYDNGTVDGDTVSVILNDKVIIAKKGLSGNAVRTTIHLTAGEGDSMQLIMYAENLGAIPPNTGVLVIQDGNTRNEIRFAGDMQKSSAIILKRKR
jgi:hypothetical protein